MNVRFGILGPLVVSCDGVPRPISAAKQRVVLAALLLHARRPVSADRLCELLWTERGAPANAAGALHTHVTRLRTSLGEPLRDRIETRPLGYVFDVQPEELDVDRFVDWRDQGRDALEAADWPTAARCLRNALAQWRGTPLTDVPAPLLRQEAIGRLRELKIQTTEWRIDADINRGAHQDVLAELPALIASDRFHERFYEQLMIAFSAAGRRTDALAVYAQAENVLVNELGIDPNETLRELHGLILAGEKPGRVDHRDAEPAGYGPGGQPRRGPGTRVPEQLPAGDDMIGRAIEVAKLDAMVSAEPAGLAPRVIAITGRGGVGKTSLALHLAKRWRAEHPDGQLYANMRGSTKRTVHPASVLTGFLRALGCRPDDIPDGLDERSATYRDLLADRRVLIMLDDVDDEGQVRALLPGDRSSSVLITARRRLDGLPGIRLLDLAELADDDGYRMLVEALGAQRVHAEHTAALDLVRLCAGLPLAVRIVAAKLSASPRMHLKDLAERLADSHRRLDLLSHHDLAVRAGMELSYRGLPGPAAALLRRLAIPDLTAVPDWMAAAALDMPAPIAEQALESLIDARLLDAAGHSTGGHVNLRFHDLTRIFAAECAEEHESAVDRAAVRDRALRGWLALADVAVDTHYGMAMAVMPRIADRRPPGTSVLDRVAADPIGWAELERANIVAATEQAAAAGLTQLAAELAEQACYLFEVNRWFDDIDRMMEAARHAAQRFGDDAALCRVLIEANFIAIGRRKMAEADRTAATIMRHCRQNGDLRARGAVLRQLSNINQFRGNLDLALDQAREAAKLLRIVGDRAGEAHALVGCGHIHLERNALDMAAVVLTDALVAARVDNCAQLAAQAAYWLGETQMRLNRLEAAEDLLIEAETLSASIGDLTATAYCRLGHSRLRAALGDFDRAEDLLATTLRQAGELDDPLVQVRTLGTWAQIRLQAGEPQAARAYLNRAADLAERFGIHAPMIDAVRESLATAQAGPATGRRRSATATRPPG